MNAVARRRRKRIISRFEDHGSYQMGGLRMELREVEIHPDKSPVSKVKWIVLGEIVGLDGYADVKTRLTAPKLEDGVLANHFLADNLDIFEGLRVTDGTVEEMDDGSVRLEFQVPSADEETIGEVIHNVHDRALARSFND